MSTITFEVPNAQAEALTREADRRGVPVGELLRQMTDQFLTREAAFQSAAEYVLAKNAELYQRLAK